MCVINNYPHSREILDQKTIGSFYKNKTAPCQMILKFHVKVRPQILVEYEPKQFEMQLQVIWHEHILFLVGIKNFY